MHGFVINSIATEHCATTFGRLLPQYRSTSRCQVRCSLLQLSEKSCNYGLPINFQKITARATSRMLLIRVGQALLWRLSVALLPSRHSWEVVLSSPMHTPPSHLQTANSNCHIAFGSFPEASWKLPGSDGTDGGMPGQSGLWLGLCALRSPAVLCLGHAMCCQHTWHLQQATHWSVMCTQSHGSFQKAPSHTEPASDPAAQLAPK
jgi:hypothetical protein